MTYVLQVSVYLSWYLAILTIGIEGISVYLNQGRELHMQ
jgi:hypothetical protein